MWKLDTIPILVSPVLLEYRHAIPLQVVCGCFCAISLGYDGQVK